MLPDPVTAEALADAASESDPRSLGAAERMRRRYPPDVAAAALDQVVLRDRARAKFGDRAGTLFYTHNGLEQATRPPVARHHARWFVDAGVRRVIDLGCGIGSDALAFADAGLEVIAVEIDPHTAAVARANLDGRAEVIIGSAEDLAARLITGSDGVFVDPARRTSLGRVWRTEDFTPRWSFVSGLLDDGRRHRARLVGAKLGPALPHREIPAGVAAEWVSDRGDTVEVGLWAGTGASADTRAALIMPDHRLVAAPVRSATRPPGRFLVEPDGAVIRAGAIGVLGQRLGAGLLDPQIAYLTSDNPTPTPFGTGFTISEILPYTEKVLRRWVHDHDIGRLEIKQRGIDLDPAVLRKRLRPVGHQAATMIISRTPDGARVLIAERLR